MAASAEAPAKRVREARFGQEQAPSPDAEPIDFATRQRYQAAIERFHSSDAVPEGERPLDGVVSNLTRNKYNSLAELNSEVELLLSLTRSPKGDATALKAIFQSLLDTPDVKLQSVPLSEELRQVAEALAQFVNVREFRSLDVTFRVGPEGEEVFAHKALLAARSAVFRAQLFPPPGLERKLAAPSEVRLPSVERKHFLTLLRFVYTDEAAVLLEDAAAVAQLATDYHLPQLRERCHLVVQREIALHNAVQLVVAEEKHSIENGPAQAYVKQYFGDLCTSGHLRAMPHELLRSFLRRDDINAEEIRIYEALKRWVIDSGCVPDASLPLSKQRGAFNDLLMLVRFPRMEPREFSTRVAPDGLLTDAELLQIYTGMASGVQPKDMPFSAVPRRPPAKLLVRSVPVVRVQPNARGPREAAAPGFSLFD